MGLYLLIPLSVVLVFIIGVIFWWSVRSGQFDDMEGPAYRMLIDDRDPDGRQGGKPKAPAEQETPDEPAGTESSDPDMGESPKHRRDQGDVNTRDE